ncbi:trypsin-1-like [Eupeodes corollae]|uniref:trypsin-1-like n=1 Tax=Eupeodes corollae TaxID=290404 RepID=UPI00249184E2|nr:trypsin-1-like [Eupeodes corollae]XP_055908443.1 trypsin-1-like [Eupeodes corollae]
MMILLPWILPLYLLSSVVISVDAFIVEDEDCRSCLTCGVSNNNRIVGGEDAEINKYPWTAMLLSRGFFRCGGSLINNKYVLTAAHCAKPSDAYKYEVHFLQNRLYTHNSERISRRISEVIVHPNYNRGAAENDIALLKLSHSIRFDDKIRPVCLPPAMSLHTEQDAIIVGWGALEEHGRASPQIQEISVPIISNNQCGDYGLKVTDAMICAGVKEGGMDSCQGDSGGPLHVIINSKLTQAGIVSWGIGCGSPHFPGVYTKVSNYIPWIGEITADACTC